MLEGTFVFVYVLNLNLFLFSIYAWVACITTTTFYFLEMNQATSIVEWNNLTCILPGGLTSVYFQCCLDSSSRDTSFVDVCGKQLQYTLLVSTILI